MKLVFKLLFLLVTQLSSYSCDDNLLVLGSRFVSEPNYTYYVITNGNFPSPVDVSLNDIKKSKSFSPTDIEDVFSISSLPIQNKLKVEVSIPEKPCKEQSVKLTRTTDLPLIFIHFAKPIYKTGEEFKFRVFFLNQKMVPYNVGKKIKEIVIFDSTGYAVRKFYDVDPSDFGAFEESMEIANDPNLGKWKIQVEIEGKKVSKSFEVQKYEEGDLEVVLDIPSVVAHVEKRVYMTIITKSDDGGFVNGEAAISLSARFAGSTDNQIVKENFKKIQLKDRKTVVMIDFENDMEIKFPTSDMVLKFDVEVTENYSQKSKKVAKEIQMMYKGRNTFQIIRKKYFKPDLKYFMKIRVKTVSGVNDNSFNQLKMNVKFKNAENIIEDKKFSINLKNGETSQVLNPTKETTKIIVDLEFDEIKKTEEIDIFPTFGANEYMQATVASKNTTIGATTTISVKCTEEMEELHLVIFGLKGIVYSKKFTDAQSKDVYDVKFRLTDEMRPEARGLLFYVKPDTGAIVYDEFSILVGFSIENSLEITADKDALPNSETKVHIKTEADSYVYLSTIDNAASIINLENEISRSEIYNELIYYLNKKFPNTPKYHFEKLNAFILEPLRNGAECGLSSRGGFSDDDNNDDDNNVNSDNDVHQYFPEVPFEKWNSTALGDFDETIKLARTFTSWRIFGISVHKDKGFTVAKVQPEIAARNNISLQIEAPSEIRTDEVFEVKLTAFNNLNHEVNGKIDLELNNAVFVGLGKNKECITFEKGVQKPKISDQKLPPNGKPQVVATFHVSTSKLETIILSATIEADSQQYTTEKIIKVWPNLREKKKISTSSILLEEPKETVFTTNGGQSIVHGNLFGPAIDGLESIFQRPMILDEEKILNFAAAVVKHKFIKLYNIKDEDHVGKEKVKKANNDMIKGYQETFPILQNILKSNDKKSILLAAQITKVLINAKDFIRYINQTLIDESLNFIKEQQLNDGSFPYFDESDHHRDKIFGESRKAIQTALIIETFLQNDEVRNSFQDVIKKSLKDSVKSDYIRAISAYNFALNNDKSKAQEILSNMDNKQKKRWHNSVLCEINSYLIRTKILLKENPSELVKNLLSKHRNSDGRFYSPYDTVLGLQALYEYAKMKNIQNDIVEFKVGEKTQSVAKFESVSINISKNDKFIVTKGLGYVAINAEFKVPFLFELNFALKDHHDGNELDIDGTISLNKAIYASIAESSKTNLIVLEAEIPRGYKYVNHVGKNMKIEKFELRKDENIAVFYINSLESGPKYSMTIKTKKVFEIRDTMSMLVNIYDYYRPNFKTIQYLVQDKNAVICQDQATKNSG